MKRFVVAQRVSICVALILLTALIALSPSLARAQGKPVDSGGAKALQLKFFLAPVQSKPGAFTTTLRIVTPILMIPDPDNAPLVCNRMPRVIEGLLSYFLQHPAPVNRRLHLDTDALDAQKKIMAAHVNRAIGKNVVSAVYILEGGRAMSSGTAARFPGATSNACGAIMEEYEKKIKAAQEPK